MTSDDKRGLLWLLGGLLPGTAIGIWVAHLATPWLEERALTSLQFGVAFGFAVFLARWRGRGGQLGNSLAFGVAIMFFSPLIYIGVDHLMGILQ